MGLGDEIMVTGLARECGERTPVLVLDRHRRPRWHELWAGTNILAERPTDGRHVVELQNGPGCRPYLDYSRSTKHRWFFNPQWPGPSCGWLPWVVPDSRGVGRVIIEPHIKANAMPGKQWGWKNWQRLVNLAPGLRWAQVGPPGTKVLEGVTLLETHSFAEAVCILAAARGAVLPEGGLHHAAAAVLRGPTVVLFGPVASPQATSYQHQVNLWVDRPDLLGWRIKRQEVEAAWKTVTPNKVLAQLRVAMSAS